MKKKELLEKNNEELVLELTNFKEEYNNLKIKKVTGIIENPLKLRILKKDIARIKTILHMREINRLKNEIQNVE